MRFEKCRVENVWWIYEEKKKKKKKKKRWTRGAIVLSISVFRICNG